MAIINNRFIATLFYKINFRKLTKIIAKSKLTATFFLVANSKLYLYEI